MTRVYVDTPLAAGQQAIVSATAANHITRVLRLRVGDEITLFDGHGGEYAASIEGFRKDTVTLAVGEQRSLERESPLTLTLAQGVSRSERMDWIIQKATELGVSRIVPVLTERTVVRLDDKQAERKIQHWRGIAVAACEQCGRNRLPEVQDPVDFHSFIRSSLPAGERRVLLSPTGDRGIHEIVTDGAGITVLIGPEGGLADTEQEVAIAAGFTPVRLGPRILRTETAAIAALTVLQREFGDL